MFLYEPEGVGVARVFARWEREREKVLRAVDDKWWQSRFAVLDSRFFILDRAGRGSGGGDERGMAPRAGLAVFDEERLHPGGRGEIAELRARELHEFRRRAGAAPALQEREGGDEFRGRGSREI